MSRIVLTDDTGRWFDPSKAEVFVEEAQWNGNNMVGLMTKSWTDRERLFRTAGKKWILEHTSAWQGSVDSYTEISDEEAAIWLSTCGYDHPDAEEAIAALEIA